MAPVVAERKAEATPTPLPMPRRSPSPTPRPVSTLAPRRIASPTVSMPRPTRNPLLGGWDPAYVVNDVALDPGGDLAYVAGGRDGFSVLDLRDPERPREVASLASTGESRARIGAPMNRRAWQDVAADRRRVFLSGWNEILWLDLSEPARPRRRGSEHVGSTFLAWTQIGLGPRALFATDLTRTPGLAAGSIAVDATDGFGDVAPLPDGSHWQDVAVSEEVLALAQGTMGLDLLDLRAGPPWPEERSGHVEAAAERVALDGARAYVIGEDGPGGDLRAYDLSDLARPRLLARRGPELGIEQAGARGPKRLGDVAAEDGRIALLSQDGVDHFLEIFDPAQLAAGAPLGALTLPGQGAAGEPRVELEGSLAAVALGEQGLRIVDVSAPRAPRLLASIEAVAGVFDVAVEGERAYAASGAHGLRVLDVADPAASRELGFYDPEASVDCAAVEDAIVYLCAGGLHVVDAQDSGRPREIARWPDVSDAADAARKPLRAIALGEGLAFLSGAGADLQVLDITQPGAPRLLGTLEGSGEGGPILLRDGLAYVAAGWGGLLVADVRDPERPVELGRYRAEGWAHDEERPYRIQAAVDLWERDGLVYVAAGDDGIHVVDVSDPEQPRLRQVFRPLPVHNRHAPIVHALRGIDDKLLVALGHGVLVLFRLEDLVDAELIEERRLLRRGWIFLEGGNSRIHVDGQRIYVAGSEAGLRILDRASALAEDERLGGG